MKKLLLLSLLVSAACGGDEKSSLFTPKPECKGDAITPYQGTFPQVISQLLTRSARDKRLGRLTPREYEVLESVAQGRSNAAIAQKLAVTERAVAKHTSNIFAKLDLPVSDDDNRRVLAVLAYLDRA